MTEINAAATISALVLSPYFDLASTYFLVSGIAGVNQNVEPSAEWRLPGIQVSSPNSLI